MQRLNRGMMDRYEIPRRFAGAVNAVQFGMDETMLGLADRLIDDAGVGVGIACVQVGEAGRAQLLNAQDGMFTALVRGYLGERAVRREQVVQSVLRAVDPGAEPRAFEALALEPGLALGLVNAAGGDWPMAAALAARLLAARHAAGLEGLDFLCLGESADCGARAAADIEQAARAQGAPPDFGNWLRGRNAFHPAVADGLAFRSDAAEAARLCADMNYADAMIHLTEPQGRLTIDAPEAFRRRWPLDRAEGVRFEPGLAEALAVRHRIFDAALFCMAAPGWLLGCDTLADCMKHARLRAFAGAAFYREVMPALPMAREAATPRVIEVFERLGNPLNANPLLRAGRGLLGRFVRGALPAMEAWASERFEAPRLLSFALAATIMLYAGARPNAAGVYEVARGRALWPLSDDPGALAVFARLSHDMPPEALAYAALADRELWDGRDLRAVEGLENRVALDIAAMQRDPAFLPDPEQDD